MKPRRHSRSHGRSSNRRAGQLVEQRQQHANRMQNGAESHLAGAGVAAGGRSVSVSPLASVTETNRAPGSPLFCGWPTTRDLVARLERRGLPARANQNERRRHLDVPGFNRAILLGNFQLDPGMRIGPLELLYRSDQRHVLVAIETFHRMVRVSRRRTSTSPARHAQATSNRLIKSLSSESLNVSECSRISRSRSAYAR